MLYLVRLIKMREFLTFISLIICWYKFINEDCANSKTEIVEIVVVGN